MSRRRRKFVKTNASGTVVQQRLLGRTCPYAGAGHRIKKCLRTIIEEALERQPRDGYIPSTFQEETNQRVLNELLFAPSLFNRNIRAQQTHSTIDVRSNCVRNYEITTGRDNGAYRCYRAGVKIRSSAGPAYVTAMPRNMR